MIIEIKIPSPGESVTEVAIGSWLIRNNDMVEKDQEIAEVETDKATLPLIAPEAGRVKIKAQSGEKIQVGDVACTVDTSFKPDTSTREDVARNISGLKNGDKIKPDVRTDSASHKQDVISDAAGQNIISFPKVKATPVARKLMEENNLNVDDIINGLKKLTRREVELIIQDESTSESSAGKKNRNTTITPMSPLRRKLSKRLVAVKNETAMLTTFNEVDMGSVLSLRKKYQQEFQELHGIKLGLMSFFMKACSVALMDFPKVNSMISADKIITPDYVDVSIAVQTEKGLMVPVVKNVDRLNIPEIEKEIANLAQKARTNKLSITEMTGGTFTITNGGVFGSMLSTPIINPPQSAILGMHNIIERPMVFQGSIEARPMMYMALSYDHRLIDGKESVSFLVRVKEIIENPTFITGTNHEKALLGL